MRVLFFDNLEYAYAARFRREWPIAMPRPPKSDQMMRVAGSGMGVAVSSIMPHTS